MQFAIEKVVKIKITLKNLIANCSKRSNSNWTLRSRPTWFVLDDAVKLPQHTRVLSNCLKCLDAFFIIPAGDDGMQQLSITVKCRALGWVAARLIVNAQILKHTT